MIYYILYEVIYVHFKDKDWYLIKALNVFQYVTFRTAYATITALLISLFFGGKLIDALKEWNVGQQIREEGPQAHQVKRGTPTMGGVLIVGSVLISTLLWARLSSVYVWTAMVATLLFAAVGFVDDRRYWLLLERTNSFYQSDKGTVRGELYRSLFIFGFDRSRAVGIIERSEFD